MVTIFSTPKPWFGHIEVIQRNALTNWKHYGFEIILFGDEPGTSEACKEFNCLHIPHVDKSSYGTPLIGPIFRKVQKFASNRMLMYVNTDILFIAGLTPALKYLQNEDKILTVGTRYNIFITDEVDFGDIDELATMCIQSKPHSGLGMDYFIFYKGMFVDMPDFILGRGCWDTWLPAKVLKDRQRLFNANEVIFAAHQNHDYSHLPVSAPNRGFRDKWCSKGPETAINQRIRGKAMSSSWENATHKLVINDLDEIAVREYRGEKKMARPIKSPEKMSEARKAVIKRREIRKQQTGIHRKK